MQDQNQSQGSAAGKGIRYLRERGLKEFAAHAREKVRDGRFDYQKWIRAQEISSVQAGYQRNLHLKRMPEVCVMILRPQETQGGAAREACAESLRSVEGQTYRHVTAADVLTTRIEDDAYVLFIRDGDILTRNAVFEMVMALQSGGDAVYADADRQVDGKPGTYEDPLFRPDYNPDYLRSVNYIGRPFMVRAGILRSFYPEDGEKSGEMEEGSALRAALVPSVWALAPEACYYDMVLRCTDRAAAEGGVLHTAKVLCHLGCGEGSTVRETEAMRQVLEEDLRRRGRKGQVLDGALPGTFHLAYEVPGEPLVSIVIPSKDNASVLENCIWSVRNRTGYRNYEIVVVENNSVEPATFALYRKLEQAKQARIVNYPHPFHFSRVLNEGVRRASGSHVILMNNDVTVRTGDWIERMLAQCCREEVGAVGPKLLYPDGRVQSAGIVVGLMGFAGSMMVGEDGEDPGYMGRASLVQDMSAVTAACMMVRRQVYQEMGGFSDELAVALNDVDFCLRLVEAGYRVLYEPAAVMIHHESLSRGLEDTPEKKRRFAAEKAVFRKRWASFLRQGDPAYNPNLSRRRCDWSQQT